MKYRSLLCLFLMILGLSVIHVADAELLSLPEDVKRIESESFMGISADRVYFPSGIEYIADDAFSGVSFIGEGAPDTYAQGWCLSHGYEYQAYSTQIEEFEWTSVAGGISITKYIGNNENVCIPSVIDNKDVISIGNNAFKDATKLKSVSFPNSLETIGQYAFYGCTLLNRIILPDSIETIDKFAFMNCTSLESIVFSSNLDAINESAFQGCTSLKSVDLPESLTYLGWRAFRECSALTHFGYPVNIQEVGGVFLYGCTSLKEVTVPEGVYKLMDFFIAGAGNVETVNLPSTLEIIGKYAFAYDNAFTSMTLPNSVETINDHAFYQCYNLKSIQFSNHLDRIEESAFQECTGLTSVDLPESLTYLGWHSFSGCSSLTHFGYPVGIREVGGTFLTGCTSLKEITVPEGVTRLMDYFVCNQGTVTTINFPSTLEEIGKYAFYGDNVFSTIEIPNGVKSIDEYAFAGNSNMVSIDIPASVTYIGISAFEDAIGLKSITFHDGLIGIDTYAFKGCSALKTISLPNTVTMLGCAVFENCSSLTTFNSSTNWNTLYVPGSTSSLAAQLGGPRGIFAGCTKLTTITIPEGAECIPRYAFSYASNLTTVNLPSTIKTIGAGAFMEANSLRTINFPDGLTEIGFGAFKNCSSLKAAELPDSVTTIGCYAFYDCTNLSSIHYPRNWTTVTSPSFFGDTWDLVIFACGNDYNIFGNDYKISSVNIPDGVKGIPPCAFQNCTGLKTVTIPDSVTQIMSKAFENCSSLPQVYISPNVTDLGDNIFNGCKVLTVWCEYGSTILQYCKDNSVKYYYLTPDGVNSPSGTLYQGDSYGLHGYARASIPLTDVTATIWNNDKSQVLQTISVNPATTDYSLTDAINYHLIFGTLPLGTYHYTLHAATDLSEETWADTTFKIVPQPLRIFISNLSLPYGLESTDYSIGGTIVSNYPITQVKTILYRSDSDEVVKNITVSQNSITYDLVALSGQLSLASYTNETLSIKIDATSNGENRTLIDTDLSLRTSANIVLNERKNQTLIDFANDSDNRGIFTTEYVDAVIDDMSWVEDGIVLMDNVLSISIFERIENLLIYNGNRQDLIELYKKEIVQSIEDGAYERFNIAGTASKYSKDLLSILKSEGKLIKEAFKDFKNTKMENFIGSVNSLIGAVKDGLSTAKDLEEAYETIAAICGNFETGLYVLEYIGSSANIASRDEFNEALNILRTEYVSTKAAVIYEHLKIIQDLILEYGEDQIKDALTDLLSENFGLDFSIALPKLFAKLTMKATGLDEVASTYKKLFVRQDLLNIANNSYKQAFDRVHNGDHSDEALLELASAISITKAAWVRANDLITTLPRYAYTVGNDYLHYRYTGRISILLTSSDYD